MLGAKKEIRGSVDSFSDPMVFGWLLVYLFVFSGIYEGEKVGRARS